MRLVSYILFKYKLMYLKWVGGISANFSFLYIYVCIGSFCSMFLYNNTCGYVDLWRTVDLEYTVNVFINCIHFKKKSHKKKPQKKKPQTASRFDLLMKQNFHYKYLFFFLQLIFYFSRWLSSNTLKIKMCFKNSMLKCLQKDLYIRTVLVMMLRQAWSLNLKWVFRDCPMIYHIADLHTAMEYIHACAFISCFFSYVIYSQKSTPSSSLPLLIFIIFLFKLLWTWSAHLSDWD